MKRIFAACILSSLVSLSFAQRPACATVEMQKSATANDPALLQSIQQAEQINNAIYEMKMAHPEYRTEADQVYHVPVVVHVVYRLTNENISDEQIESQIIALNKDYRHLNADASETPAAFASLAADCSIEFCLADKDPSGNPTNGITRDATTITEWDYVWPAVPSDANYADKVKKKSTGGADQWPKDQYLNLWVCNIDPSLLGYATMPTAGTNPNDGVVIGYKYFGTSGVVVYPYNLGRTATHEIGHWLGLYHIWGDDGGSCSGSDLIADTPNQTDYNFGCPSFPETDACSPTSPGVMFMDYMDYTDDGCMNMFTTDQKNKMRSILEGTRASIPTSSACWINTAVVNATNNLEQISISPNPTSGSFIIKINNFKGETLYADVYNAMGQLIAQQTAGNYPAQHITFDIHDFPAGCYFVKVSDGIDFITQQIILTK